MCLVTLAGWLELGWVWAEVFCASGVLVGWVELKWVIWGVLWGALHLGCLDDMEFTVVGAG